MTDAIRSIAIVGGDHIAAATALVLAANIDTRKTSIKLLKQSATPQGSALHLGGELTAFCDMAKLNVVECVSRSNGAFILGHHFATAKKSGFFPYGVCGVKGKKWEVEQGIYQYCRRNDSFSLSDFSLSTVASKLGRFALAPIGEQGLSDALMPGAVLESVELTGYLFDVCAKRGIEVVELDSSKLSFNIRDGLIYSAFNDSIELSADFWIDASGAAAELISELSPSQPLALAGLDYAECVTENITEVKHSAPSVSLESYGDRLVKLYCWRGKKVVRSISKAKNDSSGSQYNSISVREAPWKGNCLAVGSASVYFGVQGRSDLHFCLLAVSSWLDRFPSKNTMSILSKWYNDSWQIVLKESYAYSLLFCGTNIDSMPKAEDYISDWRNASRMWCDLLLQTYSKIGLLLPVESDAVEEIEWLYLLNFLVGVPRASSVLVDGGLHLNAEVSLAGIRKLAESMPTYTEFEKNILRMASV